ncbi:hypothetical protein LguiB_022496 [Lonicera macranthoides]
MATSRAASDESYSQSIADRWRWAFTANGLFSVKSGYNIFSEGEDTFHALVSCIFSKSVWARSRFGDNAGACFGFINWWNQMFQRFKAAAMGDVGSIIWGLCQNHNAMVWSDKATPAR